MSDDLRPEYDLKTLLKGGERGKYVERYKAGTNQLTKLPAVKKGRSTKP
ncbi:MAG: hypothetical protein ACJ76Y_13730 [Thermoanaerobaculia bacterium]